IFIDADGNGVYDDGEISALTDAAGAFDLGLLGPGTHALRQELPADWIATTDQPKEVATVSGTSLNLLFGSKPDNLPPAANDDSATLNASAGGLVDVLSNDSDPEADALQI